MTGEDKSEGRGQGQDIELEDLEPEEAKAEEVKGGQRGAGNWIFSG